MSVIAIFGVTCGVKIREQLDLNLFLSASVLFFFFFFFFFCLFLFFFLRTVLRIRILSVVSRHILSKYCRNRFCRTFRFADIYVHIGASKCPTLKFTCWHFCIILYVLLFQHFIYLLCQKYSNNYIPSF